MSITVAEVLTLGEMRRCKLVAGRAGLWREVKCVDTMETPDIYPWLQKCELLMTTGYSIQHDAGRVARLLHHLHNIGGAGLAMTTQYVGHFTPELIALADELEMPLIEIPSDMPFVPLTNPIMKAIVDEQNRRLQFSEEMNRKFIDLEINGGGVQQIADTLSALLSRSVVITDAAGGVLALAGGALPEDLISRDARGWQALKCADWERVGENRCRAGAHYLLQESVMVRGRVRGYVYALSETRAEDDYKNEALRHAAVSVALEFAKQKSLEDERRILNNNLFLDIMMGNVAGEEEALARANGLRWPRAPLLVAVLDLAQFEKGVRGKSESEIHTLKEQIGGIVHDELRAIHTPCALALSSDQFNCILSATADLKALREALQSAIGSIRRFSGFGARAAVSCAVARLTDIPAAHRECRDAMRAGLDLTGENVVLVRDVMPELAIMSMCHQPFCQRFVRDTLQKVAEYDAQNDAHLVRTLCALYDCAGRKNEAAAHLFLHRNTLTYRIRKIEELTNASLEDSRALMTLGLAAKIAVCMQKSQT